MMSIHYNEVNMLLRTLNFLVFTMIAVGCTGPRYADFYPCDDDGRSKPSVAIVAIRDSSSGVIAWNPAEVVTQAMNYELLYNNGVYALAEGEMGPSDTPADFNASEVALAQRYPSADFVVLLELTEDEFNNNLSQIPQDAVVICMPFQTRLNMSMRVKIVDLRPRCPRVILQEILSKTYLLPCPDIREEPSTSAGWKAHQRFGAALARRIEEVVRCTY